MSLLLDKPEAIQTGHLEISDDHVGRAVGIDIESRLTVPCEVDSMTSVFQNGLLDDSVSLLVVYDEDVRHDPLPVPAGLS